MKKLEGETSPNITRRQKNIINATNKHSRERREIKRKEEIGDDGVLQG